jgi:hypothetical protein
MYEKQMELFEDGGLRDEGGMVDEQSGNDVPVGSTRKEVRDDIPAMLSEGEFVFPADVVRYVGLENLMRIRQDAKQGLKQMDAMGQMGNGDEATMPDDLPFGMMDLVIVEGKEEPEVEKKAHGGVVHMNEGGFTTPSFTVPKFDPRNQDVRQYENADGKKLNIPFLGGKPVYPIPEGYFPVGGEVEEEKDETKEAIPTDDNDGGSTPPPQSEFQKAGGWSMDFGDPPDSDKVDLWINEAKKTTGNTPAVMTGVAALFGGLPAALVHAGNKLNAKGRDANLQRVIEAAKKTPKAGQVKALNEISTDIEKGADETLLGKLGNAIKSLFGVSDEEAQKAQTVGINSGAGLSKQKVTPTVDVSQQMIEAGFTGGDIDPSDPSTIADSIIQESLNELNIDPEEVTLESGPSLPVEAPSVEAQTEVAIPQGPEMPQLDASVVADQSPFKELFETPTIPKDPEATTPQMDVQSTLPLRTSIVSNRAKDLLSELRGSTEPAKVSSLLDQFTGTLFPSEDAPTSGDIESYLSRVAQEESQQQPTPSSAPPSAPSSAPTTPTPSGGGDDDGPDFGDRDRPDFGDRDRDTGIKVKTDDVTIKGRTDSSGKKAGDVGYKSKLKEKKEKEKAIKEGQKAGKGYEGGYGFKKGGLASRKKKK